MSIRRSALVLLTCGVLSACSSSPASESAATPPAASPAVEPTPKRAAAAKIETLADFEASTFCETYKCARDGSWNLKVGGSNHSYDIAFEEASVEVQTAADSDKVTGLGISFLMRNALAPAEAAAIEALLASVDTTRPTAPAMKSIRRNITRSVRRDQNVYAGGNTRFGDYEASAARVGRDYVLSLDR